MPVPIADLFISVSADISGAVNGLRALDNQLQGTTNSFQQARPAALALAAGGAAITAGFVDSIKVAADFEHAMSGVKAVLTPAEAQQFGAALSDLALKLGRDTVFTSRQAAAGIEELVKAGVPVEDILNGAAAAALNLAAATGISVPEAASIAATSANQFGISAGGLGDTMDTLAAVANTSASDISGLGNGLSIVGATAHGLGLTLPDTASAIGLLSNAGIQGAEAGTALR